MSELRRRLFKVVGDSGQSEGRARIEPIEEVREGIAQLLRQTRERYGQSLRDVSANLRIRMAYLQAIESGRFRELPGPTYAIGFVRSYAEYLGLDAAEIVRRFKGEVEGLDHKTHLAFPEPVPEGRVPGGAIIIVSLLVLAIGYGGWYAITTRNAEGVGLIPRLSDSLKALIGQDNPTAEPGAGQPAAAPQPAGASQEASPAPDSAPTPEAKPAPPPESSALAAPAETASTEPGLALAPASGAGEEVEAAPAEGPSSLASAEEEVAVGSTEEEEAAAIAGEASAGEVAALPAAPAIPEAPAIGDAAAPGSEDTLAPGAAPSGESRVVLHARLASWIQISNAAGEPIVSRTLAAGDRIAVPDQPGARLFTGNAGGLEILVDGRPLPALGPVGAVRRNISLDPDALLQAPAVE